ncbi:MAG: Flp pilus assembly complex ATPase component TadA [Candidatus Cloacimonetes bacterium]|nr:Flp pilus assembly complex ATPase component TadA [Candidatus Cloacimonadota bacterium]
MDKRHIDEFLRDAIDANCRWLHIISGTTPVMQDRKGVKRFDCERLLSNEVYQIVDSFVDESSKRKVLEGQDVIVGYPFSPRYSARLSVYRQRGTLGVSGKLIETKVFELKELGFLEPLIDSWLNKRSGLYLICGTPDSGRSTTQNAILQHLGSNHSWSMVQLDDVLEGEFPLFERSLLSRRTYDRDIVDFSLAVQSLMKADVNVVALGDINSLQRLEAAVRLASRGILVFGTFLSLDIENTIHKITQMLSQSRELRGLLVSCLNGIYHQSFFTSSIGEPHLVKEALTMHPQPRKHLRDGNLASVLAFHKAGSKKDCIPYSRAFESLVTAGKLEASDVPLRYKV